MVSRKEADFLQHFSFHPTTPSTESDLYPTCAGESLWPPSSPPCPSLEYQVSAGLPALVSPELHGLPRGHQALSRRSGLRRGPHSLPAQHGTNPEKPCRAPCTADLIADLMKLQLASSRHTIGGPRRSASIESRAPERRQRMLEGAPGAEEDRCQGHYVTPWPNSTSGPATSHSLEAQNSGGAEATPGDGMRDAGSQGGRSGCGASPASNRPISLQEALQLRQKRREQRRVERMMRRGDFSCDNGNGSFGSSVSSVGSGNHLALLGEASSSFGSSDSLDGVFPSYLERNDSLGSSSGGSVGASTRRRRSSYPNTEPFCFRTGSLDAARADRQGMQGLGSPHMVTSRMAFFQRARTYAEGRNQEGEVADDASLRRRYTLHASGPAPMASALGSPDIITAQCSYRVSEVLVNEVSEKLNNVAGHHMPSAKQTSAAEEPSQAGVSAARRQMASKPTAMKSLNASFPQSKLGRSPLGPGSQQRTLDVAARRFSLPSLEGWLVEKTATLEGGSGLERLPSFSEWVLRAEIGSKEAPCLGVESCV